MPEIPRFERKTGGRWGVALVAGAWMLGVTGKMPVVLTRDIRRLWREIGLLDRVRVNNGSVRIASTRQIAVGVSMDAGVEYATLLEERFHLRGDVGLSRSSAHPGPVPSRRRNDPAAPAVHGPFSVDFRPLANSMARIARRMT